MQLTKRVEKQIFSLHNTAGGSNVGSLKIDNKRASSMIQVCGEGKKSKQNQATRNKRKNWFLANMAYEQ